MMAGDAFDTGINQSGLTAEYFSSDDLNPANIAFVRTDSTINFDWATRSPHVGIVPDDNFSARWSGTLVPEYTEEHTLTIRGKANAGVRLRVNDKVLIEAWTIRRDFTYWTNVSLVAGEPVQIELEYRDTGGNAAVRLNWESPRSPKTLLPVARLQPSQQTPAASGGLLEQWNSLPGPTITDLRADADFQRNIPDEAVAQFGVDLPTEFASGNSGEFYGQRFRSVLVAPETGYYTFRLLSNDAGELIESPEQIIVRLSASPTLAYRLDNESLQQASATIIDGPTNGDGKASALDALTIINQMSRQNNDGQQAGNIIGVSKRYDRDTGSDIERQSDDIQSLLF